MKIFKPARNVSSGGLRIPSIAKRTLVFNSFKSFAFGVLDTGPKTFFLFIVVRNFLASDSTTIKALVSLPQAFGLMAALFLVAYIRKIPLRRNLVAAVALLIAAAGFIGAAFAPSLLWHISAIVPAAATSFITVPIFTAIIKENYPEQLRGRLFAVELIISMIGSALFHTLAGNVLDQSIDNYRWVIFSYGIMNIIAAIAAVLIPTIQETRTTPLVFRSPFSAISLLWRDKSFGLTVGAWFLFGFGNLLTMPLRVLLLTESKYGFELIPSQVAFIVGTLPDIMRVVCVPVWAFLFDRFNFIAVRIFLNIFSVIGIILFFQSNSLWLMIFGAALLGIFNSGGLLAWNLWVTRLANQNQTASYMSVHTFATGVRIILGAFIGIGIAQTFGAPLVAWMGIGFIIAGTALLIPLGLKEHRFAAINRKK